jgi:hypothetical protein
LAMRGSRARKTCRNACGAKPQREAPSRIWGVKLDSNDLFIVSSFYPW